MRVVEVMSSDVETAAPAEPAEGAWERMRQGHIRHLVVIERGDVVGLVSDAELGGLGGAPFRAGKTVGDVMTREFVAVSSATPVREAANLLRAKRAACLPVVDHGRLVGLVTATDLLEQLGRGRGNKARPIPRIRSGRRAPRVGPHRA